MSSLVIEWCELAGDHSATGVAHGQALSDGTSPHAAWDPATVGKIVLCPLVAPAKVETLANLLACIVGGSLHVHQMVE